jgi:hypothetical protein
MTAIATRAQPPIDPIDPATIRQVLLGGDLAKLTETQKLEYYRRVCDSLGLNPLTQPFEYLRLSGKHVLYAKKDATDQLRNLHGISITALTGDLREGVYVVTATAALPNGRTDVSTGAVPLDGLKGEARANALMKCETKAKRRVTLSICGLGMLDESEIGSLPPAAPIDVAVTAGDERPMPPDGAVYLDAVIERRSKAGAWIEVTTSQGEVVVAELELGPTLAQLALDGAAVQLTCELTPKGAMKIVEASRADVPE